MPPTSFPSALEGGVRSPCTQSQPSPLPSDPPALLALCRGDRRSWMAGPGRAGPGRAPRLPPCCRLLLDGTKWAFAGGPGGSVWAGLLFSFFVFCFFSFPRQGGRPMASGGIACVAPLIYGASLSHRIPSPCRPRWRRGPEAPESQKQSGGLSLSEEHRAAKESSCSPVKANFTATKPLMRYIPVSCMCVSEAHVLAYLWVCSQVFIPLPPC